MTNARRKTGGQGWMTQSRGRSGAQWKECPALPVIFDPKGRVMAQFLPINGVAERYATSKHSIYRWIRDQRGFPLPIVLPSGVKRWAVADLEAWEATNRANADEYA